MRWMTIAALLALGCAEDAPAPSCADVVSGVGEPDDPGSMPEQCEVEVCCETDAVVSCRHWEDEDLDEGAACEAACAGAIDAVRGQCG